MIRSITSCRFDYKAAKTLDVGVSIGYMPIVFNDVVTNASYDSKFVKSHQATGSVLITVFRTKLRCF